MKKLLTYLLTFAMLIVVLIPAMEPASAVEVEEEEEAGANILQDTTTQSKDVIATVEAPEVEDVFYVELEWGSMEFNIVDTGSRVYDPETQKVVYTPTVAVTPANSGANVFSLTNKSNHDVTATTAITDETDGSLTGTICDSEGKETTTIVMQEGFTAADTYTLTFKATENFKMEAAESVTIATINIEFSIPEEE